MSKLLINDVVVNKSDPEFNDQLLYAYQGKVRPECLCKSPGVAMYIAKYPSGLQLKRMPNSSSLHHPECESYKLPPELSGRGEVANNAISEDHESGFTNLKLGFSLTKISVNRAAPTGDQSTQPDIQSTPKKLTLRSLLHYLYEESGLNKWSPRMAGKRNWYIIRKYLLEAANNKLAKKTPLTESLFIPEPFSIDRKEELATSRHKYLGKFRSQGSKKTMGIIIAEVKSFSPARFNFMVKLKHLPDMSVFMGEDVYKRINKNYSFELALFEENTNVHLLCAFTFLLSPSGNPQIDTIAMMLTNENWLPIETPDEHELIERLTTTNRHFIKGLRYNLSTDEVIASALVTDTHNEPTAVYIIPPNSPSSYKEKIAEVTKNSDIKHYAWNVEEEPFQLPE